MPRHHNLTVWISTNQNWARRGGDGLLGVKRLRHMSCGLRAVVCGVGNVLVLVLVVVVEDRGSRW